MADPVGVHRRLRAHDRFFLDQESAGATMNVGALVIVDGDRPETFTQDLRDTFAGRIHMLPRLRQRLADVPLPGATPMWVDDQSFDVNTRIRQLDAARPPGRGELVSLAGRLVAEPLDRSGPLWDVTVVPRTAEGESAAVVRWHHALIDGMSGIEIAKMMFSKSPQGLPEAPQPWVPEPPVPPRDLAAESLALRAYDMFQSAAERVVAWSNSDQSSTSPGTMIEGLMTIMRLGRLPPNPFPPSSPGARRYATIEVDESVLRKVGQRYDVSVEVAVLAIVAGATNRVLRARGTDLAALRVFVPRTVPNRSRAATLGNFATFNILDLPVGPMTDTARVAEVDGCVGRVRQSHQAEAVSALFSSADNVPAEMSRAVAQWIGSQTFVHTVVSYMRGPRQPLYLAGRAHLGTYPLLPRNNGLGLLIGVLSLGGITTFGLVADPRAVPELEFLASALRSVSLELAYGPDTPSHPCARSTSRRANPAEQPLRL